ncbi:MAG: tRNA pseudouridine(55) synthase TruB [Bacteroidetes bacterium]|nr:MAG: tRNA pseudouridine(55) synthase TruB [Bacteroidota bacterium]
MNADDPLSERDFLSGEILLVNKPEGWTSFDVVSKIRNRLRKVLGVRKIKVGHSGTLDPMATGLLIIATGKATKQLHELQGLPKEYEGTLVLGATTPSYDAETEVDQEYDWEHITLEQLEQARQRFIGEIEQVPPIFSAIKVDGQPLYKRARRGEAVEVEPRKVTIYEFELTRLELPRVHFRVACSKGTYIRSLAHDFGQALGSGAYLTALKRTAIGPYRLEDAWELDDLIAELDRLRPDAAPAEVWDKAQQR